MTRKNYTNLDLAKFVCALLVVMIHTEPLADCAPEINFFFVNILARVAVPLFFVISGFLLFGPMEYESGRLSPCAVNISRILRYWTKIALLYGSWSLAYLLILKIPMWISTGWWGLHVVKDAAAAVLFVGTHYHLWYLLTLLYAVPLMYFMTRYMRQRVLLVVAAALWLCECFRCSYAWLGADRIPLLMWFSQRMPIIFDTAFRAVPLMLFGACAARSQERKSAGVLGILASIGFALCAAEVYLLRSLTPNDQRLSYLISTPFMVVFLLRFLCASKQISIEESKGPLLRDMSTLIYCMHPMLIELLGNWVHSKFVLWVTTMLLSVAIGRIVVTKRRYLKRK